MSEKQAPTANEEAVENVAELEEKDLQKVAGGAADVFGGLPAARNVGRPERTANLTVFGAR